MDGETLSKLTPHGVDLNKTPGRSVESLTPEDLAAAMCQLNPFEYELLLVKYCGHEPNQLAAKLAWRVLQCGVKDLPHAKRVVDYVLETRVFEQRCRACNGTREALYDGKIFLCPDCQGNGNSQPPKLNSTLARIANRLEREVIRIESEAMGKIALMLKESEVTC